MATTPRKGLPYLYVTWLAKFLAGDAQCLWQLGFQSRFKFEKVASDFNLAAWSADHNAMCDDRATKLIESGYGVKRENDNYFQLQGQTAVIAGKMDLVARKDNYAIVLDGKTGEPKNRDWHQVLIYMIVLPILWKTDMRISGEVFYKGQPAIRIEPEEVTQERKQALFDLVKRVATTWPQAKSPSVRECAWCDISKNDCPERVETDEAAIVSTGLF